MKNFASLRIEFDKVSPGTLVSHDPCVTFKNSTSAYQMKPDIETNPRTADKVYIEIYNHVCCPPDSDQNFKIYGLMVRVAAKAMFRARKRSRIGMPALLK